MAEQQEPRADDDMRPAFALEPGVPYVPGWSEADEATRLLAAELAACGLAGLVPYLHADVTVAGAGVVELGRITPAAARRLAELLAAARLDTNGDPPRSPISRPRAA